MLPQVKSKGAPPLPITNDNHNHSPAPIKKTHNIASCLIIEDHLKSMLSQSANYSFKPWNNKYAPKYPHTCFGDFTKEYLNIKPVKPQRLPDFEESLCNTVRGN